VMQENHSFDNYFGVLPYVPGGLYHHGPCRPEDHACVDGLSCASSGFGLACSNSNRDDDGSTVISFTLRTTAPVQTSDTIGRAVTRRQISRIPPGA
jgi:hypothetical protein